MFFKVMIYIMVKFYQGNIDFDDKNDPKRNDLINN